MLRGVTVSSSSMRKVTRLPPSESKLSNTYKFLNLLSPMFNIRKKVEKSISTPDPLGLIEDQKRKLEEKLSRPIWRRGFTPDAFHFNPAWGFS